MGSWDLYAFDQGNSTVANTKGFLGRPDRVVEYVLRASTVLYYGPAFQEKDRDATPASFRFKVVPGTVEQYLEEIGRKQPVKVFEKK